MKLGDLRDGRELTYDQSSHSLAAGSATVTVEQLLHYDAAGEITWASEQARSWAHSLRTAVQVPPQLSEPATAVSSSETAWFRKRWVWAIAAVLSIGVAVLGLAETVGNEDGQATTVETQPAEEEANPVADTSESESEPAEERLSISVSAPSVTESETVELAGETLPGATVTVNGQAVETDADGCFALVVSLEAGNNTIDVVGTLDGYRDGRRIVHVSRKVFSPIASRDFELLAKNPDAHAGEMYIIWGEVTQFDAATGMDIFRADTGATKSVIEYGWRTDYDQNTMLTGDEGALADVIEGDCFEAKVTVSGSYSYDTQIGGNTTVPMFEVYAISVYGTIAE